MTTTAANGNVGSPTFGSHREFRGKWYAISPAHRVCALLPWLSDDELQALADDIRDTEQRDPISRLRDGRIVDGRNRELACLVAGVVPRYETFDRDESEIPAFVVSRNVRRRHLSTAERKQFAEALLRADPERSDRDIARSVGLSNHTVATVRTDLESGGHISHLSERRGSDRKTYPAPEPPGDNSAGRGAKRRGAKIRAPVADGENPFAELMGASSTLTGNLTRAVNAGDAYGEKLRHVFRLCGLLDFPTEFGGNPRFLPLAGFHALLDLAGRPGKLPSDQAVLLIYDRANGSWRPPLTEKRRALKARR